MRSDQGPDKPIRRRIPADRGPLEAEATYPGTSWVYFEQGGQPLSGFVHPEGDVIYAFGPDTIGFPPEPGRTYVDIDGVGS